MITEVDNFTLVFASGIHHFVGEGRMEISSSSNISIVGSSEFTADFDGLPKPTSRIQCASSLCTGLQLQNVTRVLIENISIDNCGNNHCRENEECYFGALGLAVVTNVTLSHLWISNTTGYGFHATEVYGTIVIHDSTFLKNGGTQQIEGGNFQMALGSKHHHHCSQTSLYIESSYFLHGTRISKTLPHGAGLGLFIHFNPSKVEVNNITAIGNQGHYGTNIGIALVRTSLVSIRNSRTEQGNATYGGGISFHALSYNEHYSKSAHQILHLYNVQFIENHASRTGGALHLVLGEKRNQIKAVLIEECNFIGNTSPYKGLGAAAYMHIHRPGVYHGSFDYSVRFNVSFVGCTFSGNSFLKEGRSIVASGGIIHFHFGEKVAFADCNFTQNNSTAIEAHNANVFFEGHNLFKENQGVTGGALKLSDNAVVYLEHNSETVFERNSAQKAGGAVFIEQRYIPNHLCFFHTAFQNETLLKEVSVKFVNNTAGYAGSGLYGTVTECSTNTIGHKIIDRVFDVTQQPGNSSISSDPYEVCLCDTSGHMNCSIKSYKFPRSVYPGEVFNISAVAVGQMHGVAPAVIIGTVIGSHNVSLLKPREKNQNASKHCTTLTYYVVLHQSTRSTRINS